MTTLPPEAGNIDGTPFEPDNDWLLTSSVEEKLEAMRRWFLDRFEDPANNTPWDGKDKKYIYVWGGPYHQYDELHNRFGKFVDSKLINEIVHDLSLDVGHDWAPIYHEGYDYDDYLTHLIVTARHDPHRFLHERIEEVFAVLEASQLDDKNNRLLHQMAHSSLIAALEAYLADMVSYWLGKEDSALRRFISTNKDFQERSLSVAELFERLDNLADEVKKYLADFVWHRLDKVKPMLISGLQISVPDIGPLVKEVLIRHDIVHRAGRNLNGELVDLSIEDLHRVKDTIQQFTYAIEDQLIQRFPPV